MAYNSLISSMWLQACTAIERAERLHRSFYGISSLGHTVAWQPPVDMFESREGVLVRIAIPAANAQDLDVRIDPACLHVTGRIDFPATVQPSVIHRLEIPYGEISRTIPLPEGSFEVESSRYANGCLEIQLRRSLL